MRIVQAVDGNILELFTHASAATDVADTIRVIAHVVNAKDNSPGQPCLEFAAKLWTACPFAEPQIEKVHPGECMLLADPGASDHLVANLCGMVRSGKARKNSKNDSAAKRREYFENSLSHLLALLRTQVEEDSHSITTLDKIVIAFPYLVGCGIAGASWQDYYALLHDFEESGEHVFGSNCGFEVLLFDESAKHAGWAQRLGLAAPITPMPDDALRLEGAFDAAATAASGEEDEVAEPARVGKVVVTAALLWESIEAMANLGRVANLRLDGVRTPVL